MLIRYNASMKQKTEILISDIRKSASLRINHEPYTTWIYIPLMIVSLFSPGLAFMALFRNAPEWLYSIPTVIGIFLVWVGHEGIRMLELRWKLNQRLSTQSLLTLLDERYELSTLLLKDIEKSTNGTSSVLEEALETIELAKVYEPSKWLR